MKNQVETILNKINIITTITFCIYMFLVLIDQTSIYLLYMPIQKVVKLIRYCCYLIFVIKIIYDLKNEKKITIAVVLIGLLSILIAFFTKDKNIIILLITLLAIKKLDKKDIVSKVFIVYLFSYTIIVILSLLKIIPDWIFYRDLKIRHGLGFCYATDAMSIYLHIVLMYFYVRDKNYSWIELILFELVCICLFYYTDARMSFILTTLIIIVMALKNINITNIFNNKLLKRIIKSAIVIVPIGMFLIYNYAVIQYNRGDKYFIKADKVISGRLKLTKDAYLEHDITLFGQKNEWHRLGRIWIYK